MKNGKEQEVLQQLTTEEKLQLTTGKGLWQTAEISRLGINSVTVSDGPVGLRKEQDGQTVPAVAFPSVSKLACSFDPSVLREVGAAIGEQCRQENVNVLLAPGLNIKRSPRGGRNFEYFSEDPFLTSELATAYIKGVNSQGVGVCVKHFAGNSQEYGRRVCDSVIDERALREIYLSAFERVIKDCKPCAVMCAYNKLNGEYCSQNKRLLTDILRSEWKFDGIVMSDWGATDDRVKGLMAGLDLQMPQGDLQEVKHALATGMMLNADLEVNVPRLVKFADGFDTAPRNVNNDYQHKFSGKISADCTVLAKNHCNLLPFSTKDNIALIGALAEAPHFQGGGSSKVNPYRVETIKQCFEQMGVNFTYARGYNLDGGDETLLSQAQEAATQCDKVLLVVGDYGCECEGIDRQSWKLPQWQLDVIDMVTSSNSNVAIVVQSGAPVDVSWSHSAKALLLDYLGGENGWGLVDVVFGKANPTGRLAESWPQSLPNFDAEFSSNHKRALYKESIFVGYRYYVTAGEDVAFPFGYGLNYNQFCWSNIQTSAESVSPNGKITISLEVENLGTSEDADTVQIYVTNLDGRHFREAKRLVAFKKVRVKGGEKKKALLTVDVADFAHYDVAQGKFVVNGGRYVLTVAKNCVENGTEFTVEVSGENNTADSSETLGCYYNVNSEFCPTDQQFEALYGQLPQESTAPFTHSSPLCETSSVWLGKQLVKLWTKNSQDTRTLLATPLIDFVQIRPNLSTKMVKTLVDMLNGNFWKNLFPLFKQWWHQRSKAHGKAAKHQNS